MIRYYSFPQRSEKWFTYRKNRWTGSTAIHLLKGAKTPPENNSGYDNKYMLRGRLLEPLAFEQYERKYKVTVLHFGFITNSKFPHAGYSPDGIEPDMIDEVKCLNVEKHMAIYQGDIDIPVEYIAQTHFGIVITELHKIRFIFYNPDAEVPLFIKDVEVQPEVIANILAKLEATRPKVRPSLDRARQRYVQNNAAKIRASRHRRYMEAKAKLQY